MPSKYLDNVSGHSREVIGVLQSQQIKIFNVEEHSFSNGLIKYKLMQFRTKNWNLHFLSDKQSEKRLVATASWDASHLILVNFKKSNSVYTQLLVGIFPKNSYYAPVLVKSRSEKNRNNSDISKCKYLIIRDAQGENVLTKAVCNRHEVPPEYPV